MSAPGNSTPVLKEFSMKAAMAPLTPEKPMEPGQRLIYPNRQALLTEEYIMAEKEEYLSRFTHQNRVEIPVISREEYLSKFDGGAYQAHRGEALYEPSIQLSERMRSNSIHREPFIACRNSVIDQNSRVSKVNKTVPSPQWRSMTFQELLAVNMGATTSVGAYPTSNGYLSDWVSQSSLTDLLSGNQESIGLGGSYQCDQDMMAGVPRFNESLLIQQHNLNGSSPVNMMNTFRDSFIPVIPPATPDVSKRIQDNAASSKTSFSVDKRNGEGTLLSAINDPMGIDGIQSPTGSVAMENFNPDLDLNMENFNPDLDMNKTIEQKPRRRKHRPKVIREGKPKQPPKERKPKPTEPNGTPKPKRKYVRKNKKDIPSTTPPESIAGTLHSMIPDPAVKSCKNVLIINLEEDQGLKEENQIDAKDTPRRKRKYTNKNKTDIPSTTPPESGTGTLGSKIPDRVVKSCKKPLNINLEERQEVKEEKPTDAKDTPRQKRKYARKNKTNTPSTPPENGAEALDSMTPGPAVNSCRRTLNFDMESQESDIHSSHTFTDATLSEQLPWDLDPSKEKVVTMEATQVYSACMSMPEREAQSIPHLTKAAPSDCELYTATQNERGRKTENLTAASKQKPNSTDVVHATVFLACSPNYSTHASVNEGEHMKGLKRNNSNSDDARNVGIGNLMNHDTPSQANHTSFGNAVFSRTHGLYLPEINKKRKSERVLLPRISFTNATEDTRAATSSPKYPREAFKNSQYYYSILVPPFNISAEANSQASAITNYQDNKPCINWGDIDKLKSKDPTHVGDLELLKGLEECKKVSKSPAKGRVRGPRKKNMKPNTSYMEALTIVCNAKKNNASTSRKKISAEKSVTSSFNMVYNHSLNLFDSQQFTVNSNGSLLALPWTYNNSVNVEAIIVEMKQLDINREDSRVQYQGENTLIPYHAHHQQLNSLVVFQRASSIVPFEGTQSSKRPPRPKVELDDETNRVWNLLLEDINSQGVDGTGEEKQKWWEEERTVFRGRVDSFIARMRLVQGDRRFSPWKGSVVDSVVGVFLTQNVSDHLSSSAFMSVASRYPLKSENQVRRDSEEEIGSLIKNSGICIVELDDSSDTIPLIEKTVEGSICDRNSLLNDTDVGKIASSKDSHDYTNQTDNTWCVSQRKAHESQLYTCSVRESGILSARKDNTTSSQHSVICSQNSVESSRVPISRQMGASSDNISKGDGPTNASSPISVHSESFVQLLKMAEAPMLTTETVQYDKPTQKTIRPDMMGSLLNVQNKCSTVYQVQSVEECILQAVDESISVSSSSLGESLATEPSEATAESAIESHLQRRASIRNMGSILQSDNVCSYYVLEGEMVFKCMRQPVREEEDTTNPLTKGSVSPLMNTQIPTASSDNAQPASTCASNCTSYNKVIPTPALSDHNHSLGEAHNMLKHDAEKQEATKNPNKASYDWDSLRRQAQSDGKIKQRTANTMDSVDWDAVRCANVHEIADTIKERGMNNRLAERIQEFLNRIVKDHGSIDLEWLRGVPPDKAKEYLLSIRGLGLKSVECVRLLTLHHLAFPVDTNVGRIAVRLGWVPLQTLPESLQLHLLELYPILESIQKYLWPRLCKLDQRTLYELHYHMITFGKVFCTKRQPNCNACPLRGECRHFASAFASARLALPGPQDRSVVLSDQNNPTHKDHQLTINSLQLSLPATDNILASKPDTGNCEPIVEMPASPEPEQIQTSECDIEDAFSEDPNEIPTIKLDMEEFTQNLQAYMQSNKELQEGDMSKALVALATKAASIPTPKLKNMSRLRTEHHVYELPDTHQLLIGLNRREPDDPCPYLLAVWSPGETANSIEPPQKRCNFQEPGELCSDEACHYCSSQRETNSQIVRGTLLIPCRTAMRGSFPLNGTYFQVNEVFADHDSSINPIQVPRALLWNLPRRNVYFGTSIPTIFKGLSTEGIQHCFWRGYVCVRGFDQKTRAPRPLMARLHISAQKLAQARGKTS